MELVLVEPGYRGHRLVYARYLLEYADRHGVRTTLLTSKVASESAEFASNVADFQGGAQVDAIDLSPDLTGAGAPRIWFDAVREKVGGLDASRIVILQGDRLLPVLIGRRRLPASSVSALVMRPPMPTDSLPRRVAKMARAGLAISSGHVDQVANLVSPLSELPEGVSRAGVVSIPDPVRVTSIGRRGARARLGLGSRARVLVYAGRPLARKGFDVTVRLALHLGPAWTLAVIGPEGEIEQRADISSHLSRLEGEGRYVRVRGYVEEDILDAWIASATLVALLYPTPLPSGILLRSAMLGTPVVTSDRSAFASQVTRHKLGVVTRHDAAAAAATLKGGHFPDTVTPPDALRQSEDLFVSTLLDGPRDSL